MRRLSTLLAVFLGISAVAIQSSNSAPITSKPYVALLVQESGGFVPPQYNFTRLPRIVLYSDGRMFTRSDVTTMQYPGPAVQTIKMKSAAGSVPRILGAVYKTQLWNAKYNWGMPGIADVQNTDVVSQASSRVKPRSVSVYALSFTGPGLTQKQASARNVASKLLDELQRYSNKYVFTKSLPTTWTSDRWAYQVSEATPMQDSNTQDWVGPVLNGALNCAVLSKTDSAKIDA